MESVFIWKPLVWLRDAVLPCRPKQRTAGQCWKELTLSLTPSWCLSHPAGTSEERASDKGGSSHRYFSDQGLDVPSACHCVLTKSLQRHPEPLFRSSCVYLAPSTVLTITEYQEVGGSLQFPGESGFIQVVSSSNHRFIALCGPICYPSARLCSQTIAGEVVFIIM